MHRRALVVILFVFAAPLSASWWPKWDPTVVNLVVGQSVTVTVTPNWSGLVDYGNGVHWAFRSDSVYVATALVFVNDTLAHEVRITAIGPGKAAIRAENAYGVLVDPVWVEINVTCGAEPAVRAAAPFVQTARIGAPVALTAVSEIADRTTFAWFAGRDGDRTRPLPDSGPTIGFTPEAYGTHYVWVMATTPCSTSSAEFRVDVMSPRHRAARR